MATPSLISSCTNLLCLPPELLAEVWSYLSSMDFKILRLVCKALEKTTSPALFHTYTLYPHTESVNQLWALSKSTHLASHVREIIYNDLYRDAIKSVLDRHDSPLHKDDTFRARIRTLNNGSINYNLADQLELVMSLQQIFPLLPSIKMIRILENEISPNPLEIPSFYSQILGISLCHDAQKSIPVPARWYVRKDDEAGNIVALMLSTSFLVNPLRKLELSTSTLGWLSPMSSLGNSLRCDHTLAALDEMTLSFTSESLDLDYSYVRQLQTLLMKATTLSKLKLVLGKLDENMNIFEYNGCIQQVGDTLNRFANLTFRNPESSLWNLESYLQPRLCWSDKIRNLELGYIKCDSRELKEVLAHHSESLESLKLSDILLLPPKSGLCSPRACLVNLIKWLQQHLTLKDVSFAGTITNFGMQQWTIYGGSQLGLHQEIAQFITNGGPCPLDFVEIPYGYYDLGKRKYSPRVPPFLLASKEYSGDLGWQMQYSDEGQVSNGSLDWPHAPGLTPGDQWEYQYGLESEWGEGNEEYEDGHDGNYSDTDTTLC